MSPSAFLGLDVGGSKIELAAYLSTGQELREVHKERVATPQDSLDGFLSAIEALVHAADQKLGQKAPVGIGLPGVMEAGTGLQLCSNLPALSGQPVAARLRERLARPVVVGNDLQCFALSECHGGAAHGAPSMFGLILGTGAGGGLCVNGQLLRGFNHMAGEWGHWSLPATLKARHSLPLLSCACGLHGCLERYVSGTGLAALHRHLRGNLSGEALDAQGIALAAQQGDDVARRALAIHLDVLAQGLASLMMLLDPHVIVIGGGLSRLSHLYTDLPGAIGAHLFKGMRVPPILPPRFGDAGGARGAALLARQHAQAPH